MTNASLARRARSGAPCWCTWPSPSSVSWRSARSSIDYGVMWSSRRQAQNAADAAALAGAISLAYDDPDDFDAHAPGESGRRGAISGRTEYRARRRRHRRHDRGHQLSRMPRAPDVPDIASA